MNREVTVVITCFDYGEFLVESVRSALDQEDGPPQVIVVDDGSTDPHTLSELERLPPEVELVRKRNGGLSAARNSGIELVRTPYALMLDADDLLAPSALRHMRAVLDAEPELGFSYGLVRFFGAWQGILTMPPYDPYRLLYRHNIGAVALTRRELLEDVGGYDVDFAGYEDWEFWLHALERGWRGKRVETVTLLYRRHGTTMFRDSRSQYRSTFRRLRQKHGALYSGESRRHMADESELSLFGRQIYRWWWGLRPIPASIEWRLQSLLWGTRRAGGSTIADSANPAGR